MPEDRLEQRIADDARRWRDVRPTGPELATALARLDDAVAPRLRRTTSRASLLATAAAVLAAAVCLGGFVAVHGAGNSSAVGPASVPTCGKAPVTSGKYPREIAVRLVAPHVAVSGATILPSVQMRVRDGRAHVVADLGQPVESYIIYAGRVVGKYSGVIGGGTGFGARLSADSSVRIPTSPLLISGCPTGNIDPAQPDASRKPLPPGHYTLEAVLQADRGTWQLVTPPVTLVVRRRSPETH